MQGEFFRVPMSSLLVVVNTQVVGCSDNTEDTSHYIQLSLRFIEDVLDEFYQTYRTTLTCLIGLTGNV